MPHPAVHFRAHLVPAGIFPVDFHSVMKDLPPQPGPFVEKSDSTPGELLRPQLSSDSFDRIIEAVLANDQVKCHLVDKKYAVVDMHLLDVSSTCKAEASPARLFTFALLVVYNYTDDMAIDIEIELHDLRIISILAKRYQPPLSSPELERAIQLAEGDRTLKEWRASKMHATGIQITKEHNHGQFHRQVLVLFAPSDERSAHYWALVDLSSDTVCEVGQVTENIPPRSGHDDPGRHMRRAKDPEA